jgi:hypothetical protein
MSAFFSAIQLQPHQVSYNESRRFYSTPNYLKAMPLGCFALLCFALLCFALLCFALLC